MRRILSAYAIFYANLLCYINLQKEFKLIFIEYINIILQCLYHNYILRMSNTYRETTIFWIKNQSWYKNVPNLILIVCDFKHVSKIVLNYLVKL